MTSRENVILWSLEDLFTKDLQKMIIEVVIIILLVVGGIVLLGIGGRPVADALLVLGKPIAEAHAEKMRNQYKSIESEDLKDFRTRIASLEEEVRDLRKQLNSTQETSEFAVQMLEQTSGHTIDIASKRVELSSDKKKA